MAYLAIQTASTLVLHDDGDTASYHLETVAFPAPVKRDSIGTALRSGARVSHGADDLAERSIVIDCLGDEPDAEDALLALSRACGAHRAKLLWQSSAASPVIATTIRSAEVSEPVLDKNARTQGLLRVTLTLITDPDWHEVTSYPFAPSPVAMPNTVDIPVSRGDRPALTSLKVVTNAASTGLGLGYRHEPSATYEPHDAYTPTAYNLTSSYGALASAPSIDTNANRGPSHVLARVTTNPTTAASSRFRAISEVSGSGVSASTQAVYGSTAARVASAYDWVALPGPVDIPAGGVPTPLLQAGLGAESVKAENAVDDGTKTFSSVLGGSGTIQILTLQQTFPGFTGFIDAVEYTIDAAPSRSLLEDFVSVSVQDGVGGWRVAYGPTTVGTHKAVFNIPLAVASDNSPLFQLSIGDFGEAFTVGFAYSNGDYTDGELTTPYGSGEASGDDLTFKVYGRDPLGFDSETTIEGTCSEGSKTATLSDVVRLPAEDFCAFYRHSFGADTGILLDATDPLAEPAAYQTTNVEGTAGPTIQPLLYAGSPRLRPGTNRLVLAGDGTATVTGYYHPCYSNAAAGRL